MFDGLDFLRRDFGTGLEEAPPEEGGFGFWGFGFWGFGFWGFGLEEVPPERGVFGVEYSPVASSR